MIRDFRDADIAAITGIYNHYIEHTAVSFEEVALAPDSMQARVQRILDSGFPWLVAEADGQVAGYCYGCRWNECSAYRYTAEISVYLAPDTVGKGCGTRLYTVLFDRLRNMGIRRVIGGISLPNAASVALHEKMGMKQVALFEKVGYKFGQWLDVGYWQADLGNTEANHDASKP